MFCIGSDAFLQSESFGLYALYSKNKPQSDALILHRRHDIFKVCSGLLSFSLLKWEEKGFFKGSEAAALRSITLVLADMEWSVTTSVVTL